jgi:hypothetical protein
VKIAGYIYISGYFRKGKHLKFKGRHKNGLNIQGGFAGVQEFSFISLIRIPNDFFCGRRPGPAST